MDDLDAAESLWDLFEQESESYLAQIEESLSGSAEELADPEAMGTLFRAFHSLKGVSASLGLTGLETITHYGEDLLDMFRNGEAQPDEAARELLLYAADSLVSLREACLESRSDIAGDATLVADLKAAKTRLKGGGAPAPAAKPATPERTANAGATQNQPQGSSPKLAASATPPVSRAPEPQQQPTGQKPTALQVSKAPADPSESEFQDETVGPFAAVVSAELGHLAEALENPAFAALDSQEIIGSVLPIREAANDAGYLGIADVLNGILGALQDSETLDKTALTRGLCIFVHRLRVLSELADSGLSMENVDDSMSPHISKEARDVIDRLGVNGGQSKDWELVGILARALGVHRLSALARLTSELTALDDWRERPGALAVVEEIRKESQVIGIEGLDVSSLDVRQADYDRLRDQMALLLTNAEAAVAELRQSLGDEIFNSLSPDARNKIADFLKGPGARLLEVQAVLADGNPDAHALMNRLNEENVISNRVLVEVDPDLYQFLIGIAGPPERLVSELKAMRGAATALKSWAVLAQSELDEETAAAPPSTDDSESSYLVVADDAWEIVQQPKRHPEARQTMTPDITEWAPSNAADAVSLDLVAPASRPPQAEASAQATRIESTEVDLPSASTDPKVPAERKESGSAKNIGGSSLRVSSELVDNYLDSVAELRLCLSRLEQGASEAGFGSTTAELRSAATQTSARTAERLRAAARQIDNAGKVIASQIARAETTLRMLHSVTLELRVVPISIVLGRMPRLVRDLARSLGKQVNLDIEDGDIQIDKSMVDALMEPMVHMIRNAMDHGIERPEERARTGKPSKATLTLKATQNGNVARIMIADDGRGLNTAVIRAKAIERGLLSEQDAMRMPDREIQRQIFAPGFSTAAAITETSGRGVGMDVVLVTIRRLGGSIDIDSVEGEGTKFYLNFPVSAALQRIVVVSDGERDLGLPERAIVEVIEVEKKAIQTVGELAGIQHRDGFLPVRAIETMLGWDTPEKTAKQTVFPVVIIGTPERRVGVAVARVKRRQEVFMKELHPALNAVDVLAGATVMGEGQPLLVLDPETLIAIAGA
ncbi:ATP-binding protein [Thalassobaculum sp.]|uniref:chemotaxis protein CheA n=1 Tax=Thalassobaculum sp. TaxID=2022740 RepID=UPI0032EBD774